MKALKAYLNTQKEVALTMWAAQLQEERPNLILVKHWLDRVIVVDQLIKELGNGKKSN